jgi:hypothetical protein
LFDLQPPPLATIDLFPLGAPDAACERLSALLTSLRDAVATLRTCETPATSTASGSDPNPQISLSDLAKKAAQSDAKAHKWEVEELRATIAGLRDELSEFFVPFNGSAREGIWRVLLIFDQRKGKGRREKVCTRESIARCPCTAGAGQAGFLPSPK